MHVHNEHPLNEVGRFRVNVRWDLEFTGLHFAQEVWHVLVVKRESSSNKCIKNYADTPYIGFDTLISLSSDDLWAGIVRGATASLKLCVGRLERGHTPIRNLNQFVLRTVNKNVFRLEVTVCDRKGMTVRETMNNLFEIRESLERWKSTSVHNKVEEFSPFNPFKNEEATGA